MTMTGAMLDGNWPWTSATNDGAPDQLNSLPDGSRDPGVDRSEWPVGVGRVGSPEPRADNSHLTPSQRISLCGEVTKQAWALTGAELDESIFVAILRLFHDEHIEFLVIGVTPSRRTATFGLTGPSCGRARRTAG
jgi:hypothetical protein